MILNLSFIGESLQNCEPNSNTVHQLEEGLPSDENVIGEGSTPLKRSGLNPGYLNSSKSPALSVNEQEVIIIDDDDEEIKEGDKRAQGQSKPTQPSVSTSAWRTDVYV